MVRRSRRGFSWWVIALVLPLSGQGACLDWPRSDVSLVVDDASVRLQYTEGVLSRQKSEGTATLLLHMNSDNGKDCYSLRVLFDLGAFEGLQDGQQLHLAGSVSGDYSGEGTFVPLQSEKFEAGPGHSSGVKGVYLQHSLRDAPTAAGAFAYAVNGSLTIDRLQWVVYSAGDDPPRLSSRISLSSEGALPPVSLSTASKLWVSGVVGAYVDSRGW